MTKLVVVKVSLALLALAAMNRLSAESADPTKTPLTDDQKYVSEEHQLRQKLFVKANYDSDMPPMLHSQHNLTLQFGITAMKVADLDEVKQLFIIDGFVKMAWTDFRLTWNTTEYNVNQIHVNSKNMWVPDISLYNTGDANFSPYSSAHPLLVFPTGYVMYIPQARLAAHCEMNIKHFPFDKHVCNLMFGSWTYDAYKLNIIPFKGTNFTVDTSYMEHHAEWELSESNGTKAFNYYPCCPKTPYAFVSYAFEFDRKPGYFVHIFVVPAVVLALLIPFMFTMTHEYGEKIMLGGSIMISLFLLIIMLSLLVPGALVGVPLLAQYYASSIVLVAISIVLNIATNKMLRSRTRQYPHKFFSWLCIDIFGKCLCLDKDAFRMSMEDDHPCTIEQELGETMDSPRVQTFNKPRPGQLEWIMIGIVVDRVLFILFALLVAIISIVMLNV